MTLEEFLNYDDGTDVRYELVNGVLTPMGAESTLNTRIAVFLLLYFSRFGIPNDWLGIKQYIAVNSLKVTARDPDLIVHSEASARSMDGAKEACLKPEDPLPSLVIEIVSPGQPGTANYDRDYVEKRREYAERGIPEYWLIDPQRQVVLVLTLWNGKYQEQRFQENQLILSPALPSLNLTAEQVLRAGK
jgi:Uma2 family endonuclease